MSETANKATHAIENAFPDVLARSERQSAKKQLALALRALRKKAGLTQSQLAERAGWAQPAVSRLESPHGALPETGTIIAYADVCEATTSVVFHRPNDDIVEADLSETQGEDAGSNADA